MTLHLYHLETCPFSAKVRNYIEDNDLKNQITYYDVSLDPDAMETLLELTDDEQVPCLVIDGIPILESREIISWLDENLLSDAA